MFTGLVQTVGYVAARSDSTLDVRFRTDAWDSPLEVGESVAVNGCCLTVVSFSSDTMRFDVSLETWSRTALGRLGSGARINLERAMRPIDRFGGHIVQGHVDTTGKLVSRRETESGEVFRFEVPADGDKYLIDKGSISVEGISLTVVNPEKGQFDVWIIPHTLDATNLSGLEPGDSVNIEYDVLAKHVEKLLKS